MLNWRFSTWLWGYSLEPLSPSLCAMFQGYFSDELFSHRCFSLLFILECDDLSLNCGAVKAGSFVMRTGWSFWAELLFDWTHTCSFSKSGCFFTVSLKILLPIIYLWIFWDMLKKITSFFCVNKSTLVLIAASNLSPTGNVNNFKGFFFYHCTLCCDIC